VTANSSNGYITQSSFWPGRRLLGFSDLSGFVVALMLAPPPCPLPPSIVSNLRGSLAFWSFACAVALAFDGKAGVRKEDQCLRGRLAFDGEGGVSHLRGSLAFWSFACAVALAFDGRAGVRREGQRSTGRQAFVGRAGVAHPSF
jgi:hypothetical protein